MMKRLITLISTKGKTSKEVAKEAFQNFQKYQEVSAKASQSNELPQPEQESDIKNLKADIII